MPFAQVIENDYCIEIKLKFYLLSEKCIGGDISEDLDGESFFFNILEYMDALRSCFLLPGKKAFFFFLSLLRVSSHGHLKFLSL